ncbi:hypothetical protein Tco_0667302, partial [Tanacetum coccineum]
IPRGLKPKEETFQVVLDALALTTCYPAFIVTTNVPEGRDFDVLPFEEDTISFLRDLGHTGVINSLNDVVVDQMHQPWRTFVALINRSLSGKTSALDKLRLSRAQILWGMYHQKYVDYLELLWEDFTYQIDNKVYKNPEMKGSKAYKTYLSYATGAVPPKIARKFKKSSPSKKDSVPVQEDEEPVQKGKRVKRSAKKSSTTPAAAQLKEVRKKSFRDFHKTHPSGSGTVAKKSPSVEKITPTVTSEGTGDSNNEQEASDEGSGQENESEEQESDLEQDEESDDDNQ